MMTRTVEIKARGGNIGDAWVEERTAEAPRRGGQSTPKTVGGPRRRGGQLRPRVEEEAVEASRLRMKTVKALLVEEEDS